VAAVSFGYLTSERESEASAIALRRVERQQRLGHDDLAHAWAPVTHLQMMLGLAVKHSELGLCGCSLCFVRIFEEIDERPADLRAV
jgi:hypothetical protein